MNTVSFRYQVPAVKRRAEQTGTGINGEQLHILFTVKQFREVTPRHDAFCIKINIKLVGYHPVKPVILYTAFPGKSGIKCIERGIMGGMFRGRNTPG